MKFFEDGKMVEKTNHCLKTLSDGGVVLFAELNE